MLDATSGCDDADGLLLWYSSSRFARSSLRLKNFWPGACIKDFSWLLKYLILRDLTIILLSSRSFLFLAISAFRASILIIYCVRQFKPADKTVVKCGRLRRTKENYLQISIKVDFLGFVLLFTLTFPSCTSCVVHMRRTNMPSVGLWCNHDYTHFNREIKLLP